MNAEAGWGAALRAALAISGFRRPAGSVLLVMRASTVFLALAAVLVGTAAAVFDVRVGDAVSRHFARLALLVAVGTAAVVGALLDREPMDLRSAGALAASIFRVVTRQLLAAAVIGPLGLVLAWSTADRSLGVLGAAGALALIVLWAPTDRRVAAWQQEVSRQASELSVSEALGLPYGPDQRTGSIR